MDNIRPANKTATLGLDQSYRPLHIEHVTEDGFPMLRSLWWPNAEELEMLNNGGCVSLSILGMSHPPVRVDVVWPPILTTPTKGSETDV